MGGWRLQGGPRPWPAGLEAGQRLVERRARAHRRRRPVGIRTVVAADLDRRALHLGELADDLLLVGSEALGQRREARRRAPRRRSARPAPAPSTAPGRSGCRGCRARPTLRDGERSSSSTPPGRAVEGRRRAAARAGLSSLSASISSETAERQELAQRVPAQVVLPRRTAGRASAPSRRRRSRTGRRRSSAARSTASSRSCRARGSGTDRSGSRAGRCR